MLVRPRSSRILYTRKLFDYPISLSYATIAQLGLFKTFKIGTSYCAARLFPYKNEQTLDQFMINRFGTELFNTFFKSYTEKVWGIECSKISAQWGAQRIKGLSIRKALTDALRKKIMPDTDLRQKNTETSLIGTFLYPKYGPGHLWQVVAEKIRERGGDIIMHARVDALEVHNNVITAVGYTKDGVHKKITGDYFFSTMAVKDLIAALKTEVPSEVRRISNGLPYRDFITVGLLLTHVRMNNVLMTGKTIITDNWIYIQEPEVSVGRMQIFNNWSPYMVADSEKIWVGLEYFCQEGDSFWNMSDAEIQKRAIREMETLGMIQKEFFVDGVVIRAPKAYPAYFGTYNEFDCIRKYVDTFKNVFLLGRNGMHKYNNQDHAMLTAMTAVDNIIAGKADTENIWEVNTEQTYHEKKTDSSTNLK